MLNKKVLIIEDEIDISELEEMILKPENFDVRVVSDPLLAVKVASDFLPDVILLDLNLPKLSGWELYDMFRSDVRFSSTPIAIVTASDEGIDKMIGMMKNTDAYITKPFGRRQLLDTVNKLCSR